MDFLSSTRLRLSFARTGCVFFQILPDGLILPRNFKLHIAIDEAGKIVAFRFANGSRHDVKEAENLLKGRMGTAIGDKGYCSQQLKTCFAKTALRLIAHARKNMKNGNTPEKKQLLRRRNPVERVIAKLKRHMGDSFSRFRAWGSDPSDYYPRHIDANIWATEFCNWHDEFFPLEWKLCVQTASS